MKKILTVSLVAVMAVSAAHAKIASVEYVEGADVLGLTTGQTVTGVLGDSVVPAVKALQDTVSTLGGTGTNSVAGKIEAALESANGYTDQKVGALADGAVQANADAIAGMNLDKTTGQYVTYVQQANGNVTAASADFADALSATETNAPKAKVVHAAIEGLKNTEIKANADAIAAMDLAQVGTEGSFIELVSEENGKVSATAKGFAATVTTDGKIAPSSAAVATYVGDAIEVLTNNVIGGQEARLSTAEGQISGLSDALEEESKRAVAAEEGLQGQITNITKDNGAIDAKVNALANGAVKANTQAIAGMNLDKTTGQYVTYVQQANGNVTAASADFADALSATETNAPKAKVVHAAIDAAVETAGTNADAMIQLSQAMTDCANKQCALTIEKGKLKWEEVQN